MMYTTIDTIKELVAALDADLTVEFSLKNENTWKPVTGYSIFSLHDYRIVKEDAWIPEVGELIECGLDRVEATFVAMDGDRYVAKFGECGYKGYGLVRPIKRVARDFWIDDLGNGCVGIAHKDPEFTDRPTIHVREVEGEVEPIPEEPVIREGWIYPEVLHEESGGVSSIHVREILEDE